MPMQRQGDLLFVTLPAVPQGTRPKDKSTRVLAYGEATGHVHEIDEVCFDDVDLYTDEDGNTIIESKKPVQVWHRTNGVHDIGHETVTLPKGVTKVVQQREFNPISALRERKVLD